VKSPSSTARAWRSGRTAASSAEGWHRDRGDRLHQILIPQNGIMILENVNAEEAVRDKLYEGLFTLGPSRITGAVQAIINPIFLY
jgi:hypothetical protein